MELIRSFIAIELPEEIRTELGQVQASLKTKEQTWMKWVNPDSIHLTLKFLGDIAADKVKEILEAMTESVSDIPAFHLQIQDLGVFPGLKKIRVVWVGITGDLSSLRQIQNNIETNLSILGYPAEEREFTPHLTLGRVRFQIPSTEQQKFVTLLTSSKYKSAYEIKVGNINLMKSRLTSAGAIYTKIGSVPLKPVL